jgi:hypothetical protein
LSAKCLVEREAKNNGREERLKKIKHEINFVCGKTK